MGDYTLLAYKNSKTTTKEYSSSFFLATILIDNKIRRDIYAIYGLVRLADELVDTLRPSNMLDQLNMLEEDVYQSIKAKMSLNTIVHSFVYTVNRYNIPKKYIKSFFVSMRVDVDKKSYKQSDYDTYIYGSAEVVGLMCLYVFCGGSISLIEDLKPTAQALGSAFQKVNFLRDMQFDHDDLTRTYFPGVDFDKFNNTDKDNIIEDIRSDFDKAYKGIEALPRSSKYAVLLAYKYYCRLLKRINNTSAITLKQKRVRINNMGKLLLFLVVYLRKLLHI